MRPRRSLGQVFLRDREYIQKIFDTLDIKGEIVLEIGSGKGNISEYLSYQAKHLCCIEIDPRFYGFLKNKFSQRSNVKVIRADILSFPLSKLGKGVVVFGNVPYRISSSLIDYLINYRDYIKRAYLTFQKEFTQKLLAQPSKPAYNVISCYIQYYAKLVKIFDIPARCFWPQPKIDSTFIKIEFYRHPVYKVEDEEFLFKIIHKAFSQRRKKIVNSLKLPEKNNNFFSSLGIKQNLRAEDLTLEDYVAIANKLYSP